MYRNHAISSIIIYLKKETCVGGVLPRLLTSNAIPWFELPSG